jgi:hypothetical protein
MAFMRVGPEKALDNGRQYQSRLFFIQNSHKMKTPFTVIALLLSITCSAQHHENEKSVDGSIPTVDGNYEYLKVVKCDTSFTKDRLYKLAKLYFVNTFKSAKDVIQYDENGTLIGKGVIQLDDYQTVFTTVFEFTWYINYTTEIICKDGRYRYRLHDISINQVWNNGEHLSNTNINIDQAIENTKKGSFKKISTRLFNSMLKSFSAAQSGIEAQMTSDQLTKENSF